MIDIIAAVIIAGHGGHGHGGHHRAHHARSADYQVIEGCHWNGSTDWVYEDGSLCRGTGEDPTTDGLGMPACADHRLAVPVPGSGRVMCVSDDDDPPSDDPDDDDEGGA